MQLRVGLQQQQQSSYDSPNVLLFRRSSRLRSQAGRGRRSWFGRDGEQRPVEAPASKTKNLGG